MSVLTALGLKAGTTGGWTCLDRVGAVSAKVREEEEKEAAVRDDGYPLLWPLAQPFDELQSSQLHTLPPLSCIWRPQCVLPIFNLCVRSSLGA